MELKNDSIKKTHLRKTNRKNPLQTLQIQLRVEHHERNERLRRIQAERVRDKGPRRTNPTAGEKTRQRERENHRNEEEMRHQAILSLRSQYHHLSDKELKNEI